MKTIFLKDFTHNLDLLNGERVYVVVKSLNQIERRRRLIEDKEKGRLGRVAPRETAEGLLGVFRLDGDVVDEECCEWVTKFREPRGVCRLNNNNLLLTEIDRVLELTPHGEKVREFRHDYFAFLHTVEFNELRSCFLVVSAGYDAVFEVSYPDGKVIWEWFGWEHGFNPNKDGEFLTRRPFEFSEFKKNNVKCRFVNPSEYGETGLLTSGRTTHPSVACYDFNNLDRVLIVAGMENNVLALDRTTGKHEVAITGLASMPHALKRISNGWIITDTMKGEFRVLNDIFETQMVLDFSTMPGKVPGMEGHEWLQGVFALRGENHFLAVDSNRGLFVVDLNHKEYCSIAVDQRWCVQEVFV